MTKKPLSSSVNPTPMQWFREGDGPYPDRSHHALGYGCHTCRVTGSARPRFSNRAGKTLHLLGAVCLVLILTERTVCEGKLMLSHVFVSTDVEEACALDLLRLPETVTWTADRLHRAGGQWVLWCGAVSKLEITSFSRNVEVLQRSAWPSTPYENLLQLLVLI